MLERPIYVTGLMKSGTTLLLSLLDGHSDLLAYPDEPSFERLFLREYQNFEQTKADWLFGTPNPLHFNNLIEDLLPAEHNPKQWRGPKTYPKIDSLNLTNLAEKIEVRGLRREDAREAIDIVEYHRQLLQRLCSSDVSSVRDILTATVKSLWDAVNEPEAPRSFVFKQPLPKFRQASFQWFFSNFPHGRCIVLVRDPRGYAQSLIDYHEERRGEERRDVPNTQMLVSAIRTLERDYRRFTQLPSRWGSDRVIVVRYEDLVMDIEDTMHVLADFLDVPFCDSFLHPTKLGKPVDVPTSTQRDGAVVHQASVDRWQEDLRWEHRVLVEAVTGPIFDQIPYERKSPLSVRVMSAAARPMLKVLRRLLPRRDPATTGPRKSAKANYYVQSTAAC